MGMKSALTALVFGVIIIVVGLVLESTILTQAESAGQDASIGSFSGAQDVNDLIPLVYNVVILTIGVGLIGLGATGAAGVGPMGRRK